MERAILWEQLAVRVTPGLYRVLEFARKWSYYGELSAEDQLVLLKAQFFEIWLIYMCQSIANNQINFVDGFTFDRENMECLYDVSINLVYYILYL